jgi:hypothetical protein
MWKEVVGTYLDVYLLIRNLPAGTKESQKQTQLTQPDSALESELETFRARSRRAKHWGEMSCGLN